MNIIDRRLNPQGKSLANRQRFLRRAKEQVVKAVRDASGKRGIQDIENGEKVTIAAGGVREPSFHRASQGGVRDYVVPGNKEYVEGDTIQRPDGGGGGRGSEGSADGEGEDEFRFVLSRDEFLDIFLEDLELPDLVKQKVKQSESHTLTRAGYSVSGSPANLNLVRTMRNSLSRRIALKRPKRDEIRELEELLREAEEAGEDADQIQALREQLEHIVLRSKRIPFIDPIDVRYNRFESVPKPIAQAVMFCLMDVSGSMTEHMKDLAKRFFMLLYLFLKRNYERIDVVFIRHHTVAKEVDEEDFFHSRESGGTVVSSALKLMVEVIHDRYPPSQWNIYCAQASDGDNWAGDSELCGRLLRESILPLVQYYAYVEVASEEPQNLWEEYLTVKGEFEHFAMQRIIGADEIYPVLHDLFQKRAAWPGR